MTRTFIQTHEFSRRWDSLGFTDDDLNLLEMEIMNNPNKYPIMRGTGGLRKARIAMGMRKKKNPIYPKRNEMKSRKR